jgi:predicted secreted protein
MGNKINACFLIFCLLASISISLLACTGTSTDNLDYYESDSDKTVIIHLDDSFKINLSIASGYSWNANCTIDNESVIGLTNYEYKSAGSAILGIGTQIWTFKAVGTGEATITNRYSKVGSQNIKSFTLSVVVE